MCDVNRTQNSIFKIPLCHWLSSPVFYFHNTDLTLEVSMVHGQTVGNNGLTPYGCLLWTVDIIGRQQFVNGLSLNSHVIL